MILEKGDMWSVFHETDIFMITTNPILRKDGAVVMGRGIAKEAKDKYPTLPFDFGRQLPSDNVGVIGIYDETPIWWFMVKDHWSHPANLEIIYKSVQTILNDYNSFLGRRVDLNFPGIGNGGLPRADVLPLLEEELPDNFHVWEKN